MVKFICCLLVALSVASASPILGDGRFGDKFQGDIKLTAEQQQVVSGIVPTTGWTYSGFRWPTDIHGYVQVPYNIDRSGGFSQGDVDRITNEFRVIESQTCIRFVQHSWELDYIEVINSDGCWSWLGRVGGRQELSLSLNGCTYPGVAMHEAIHALGYDHMHNHIDRDNYVQIFWENIDPNFHSAFDKVDPEWFSNFDTPYDLWSVMHYPRWAFSNNGQDAILPHNRDLSDVIGASTISNDDVTRINRMYQCLHH